MNDVQGLTVCSRLAPPCHSASPRPEPPRITPTGSYNPCHTLGYVGPGCGRARLFKEDTLHPITKELVRRQRALGLRGGSDKEVARLLLRQYGCCLDCGAKLPFNPRQAVKRAESAEHFIYLNGYALGEHYRESPACEQAWQARLGPERLALIKRYVDTISAEDLERWERGAKS